MVGLAAAAGSAPASRRIESSPVAQVGECAETDREKSERQVGTAELHQDAVEGEISVPVKAAHNGEIRCRGSAAEAADAVVAAGDREAADAVVADIDRDEAAVDLPAARSQSALSIVAGANPAISASGGSYSA